MDQPVNRYLQDAIAVETSIEQQLMAFAEETRLPQARELFLIHSRDSRAQSELLTARLRFLGGATVAAKSPLVQALGRISRPAHPEEERTALDLILAFALENAQVAMYETLRIAAGMAGDKATTSIVEQIQVQEQQAAEKIWRFIGMAAERRKGDARYLEEAHVVAKNFLAHLPALDHDNPEKSTEHLMIGYATAAAEMALYEAMQAIAKAANDRAMVARAQQAQLKASEDHRLAWEKLPEAARASSRTLLSMV